MDEKKKKKSEAVDIEIEDGTQETSESTEKKPEDAAKTEQEAADNSAKPEPETEPAEDADKTEQAGNSEEAEKSEEGPEEVTEETVAAESDAEKALAEAEAKADEMSEKYLRLLAEFQNYKKRTAKEKEEVYAFGNEKLMLELLKVLDNFERALETKCSDEKYSKGMELIFKQLQDTLQKAGLEEIEALGKEFDPNFHNAVTTEENPDYESGQVSGVLQKGYTLNKKVIRPSMVKVNK